VPPDEPERERDKLCHECEDLRRRHRRRAVDELVGLGRYGVQADFLLRSSIHFRSHIGQRDRRESVTTSGSIRTGFGK
jgi:hypothetical protein